MEPPAQHPTSSWLAMGTIHPLLHGNVPNPRAAQGGQAGPPRTPRLPLPSPTAPPVLFSHGDLYWMESRIS